MCNRIEYKCIAQCSDECTEIFKTNKCRKLKTYNKCEKCKVYVCKECCKNLQDNKINYCLICREDILEKDILEEDSIVIVGTKKNLCSECYEKIKYIDCNKRKYCIDNFFQKLYYSVKNSESCSKIIFFLGLIFIPLIPSLIFNILYNGLDSISDILSSNDNRFIFTIILLAWLYGFIFCITVIHIYLRCCSKNN